MFKQGFDDLQQTWLRLLLEIFCTRAGAAAVAAAAAAADKISSPWVKGLVLMSGSLLQAAEGIHEPRHSLPGPAAMQTRRQGLWNEARSRINSWNVCNSDRVSLGRWA